MTKNKAVKVKIFSHTDLDGVSSPLLLKAIFTSPSSIVEYDFLKVSHCETGKNGTIDDEIIGFINSNTPVDEIYITDLCPSIKVLRELDAYSKHNGVTWKVLDHHKTALEAVELYPNNAIIEVVDESTGYPHSATTVIFKHFLGYMPHQYDRDSMSDFADIVRCYDCWDWVNNPSALFKKDANDLNNLFYFLGRNEREALLIDILTNGVGALNPFKSIIEALNNKEEEYICKKLKEASYGTIEGLVFSYVFGEQYVSTLGNSLANVVLENGVKVDFSIVIKGTNVSLRASEDSDVDVSSIAKKYFNGGGHQKAAGGKFAEVLFYCKNPNYSPEGSSDPTKMFDTDLFIKE